MALNFPTSPTLNQLYTFNGKTWKWDGAGWMSYNVGLTGPVGPIGPIGPTGPTGSIPTDYVSSFDGNTGAINIVDGGIF